MSAPGALDVFPPRPRQSRRTLGLKMGRANLEEFADTLLALAKADRNILVVTSDSRGSGKLGPFGQALPQQIVEVGIAEQNLVGIAAGLAACGQESRSPCRRPAFSRPGRWSRSRTTSATPTCR